jgi:hypothetical protein
VLGIEKSGGEGGMPGAVSIRAHDVSETRIDYVQHALCAWLRYNPGVQLD